MKSLVLNLILGHTLLLATAFSGEPSPRGPLATHFAEVESRMKPFASKRSANSVDPSTLDGKIVTGYQGWFFAEGDGSKRGWTHFGPREFKPGKTTIDMWPDMSEADPDECYPTDFRHADGSVATVFSAYNPKTVNRHFKWMAEYGIDSAFLQRFGSELRDPQSYDAVNAVMDNVRTAANANGRTWVIMYDLSGLNKGEIESVIFNDWKRLIDLAHINADASYQQHRGKPVVAIWGVGFNDNRGYTLEECDRLIEFLKNDPKYGGNTVMLGVPYYWRKQINDATDDPRFHKLLRKADIISPWAVTRYHTIPEFEERLRDTVTGDTDWTKENHLDYLPVVFAGFQWKNLNTLRKEDPMSGFIPRQNGELFWAQGVKHIQHGTRMIYLAMFDEIDEATALFKVSNNPPVGESQFATYGKNPPDHFLWLSSELSKVLKAEKTPSPTLPQR